MESEIHYIFLYKQNQYNEIKELFRINNIGIKKTKDLCKPEIKKTNQRYLNNIDYICFSGIYKLDWQNNATLNF